MAAELPPHGHEPAPRERFEPPAAAMVVRGLFMAAAAILAAGAAGRMARSAPGALAAGPLSAVALLLAWAGLVHLGGGAKFDDHPWV
jgi:hypothetical protein